MRMYLINFIKAYMGNHGKNLLKAQTSVIKSQCFSPGDQCYENKCFIFQFFVAGGLYVQNWTL